MRQDQDDYMETPSIVWVKVITDGPVKNGWVAAGAIVKDSKTGYLGGYSYNRGRVTILQTEMLRVIIV